MSRRTPSRTAELAVLVALCLGVAACKDDDSSPTGPTPVAGTTTPAATGAPQVRGTERLAWTQIGDTSKLRFRAYVDNKSVDLPGATCSGGSGDCSAPLPAMTDGVHTIELVNVLLTSGVESARSEGFTVQKVAARSIAAAMPLASSRSAGVRLESTLTIGEGLSFTTDIVATGVRAPAQLAALPDGRLLLSDADGRVRIVRPGQADTGEAALEAATLTSSSAATMGLASHPNFAQNRLVYVSLLERDRAERLRLRVVRLREVGDTLGEAASLFEAPLAAEEGSTPQAGPRMAFGPDRLLYVMLPPGMEFVDEPAASTPRASMLRLTDEGRAAAERLEGVAAIPLAFTWHPTTGALWMMFRGQDGVAGVRSLGGRDRVSTMRAQAQTPALRAREVAGTAGDTLSLQSAPDDLLVAQALLATRADGSKGLARLALPVQAADGTLADSVGDVVAGEAGTLFVATSNGIDTGAASDVVVRLTPVQAR